MTVDACLVVFTLMSENGDYKGGQRALVDLPGACSSGLRSRAYAYAWPWALITVGCINLQGASRGNAFFTCHVMLLIASVLRRSSSFPTCGFFQLFSEISLGNFRF